MGLWPGILGAGLLKAAGSRPSGAHRKNILPAYWVASKHKVFVTWNVIYFKEVRVADGKGCALHSTCCALDRVDYCWSFHLQPQQYGTFSLTFNFTSTSSVLKCMPNHKLTSNGLSWCNPSVSLQVPVLQSPTILSSAWPMADLVDWRQNVDLTSSLMSVWQICHCPHWHHSQMCLWPHVGS